MGGRYQGKGKPRVKSIFLILPDNSVMMEIGGFAW